MTGGLAAQTVAFWQAMALGAVGTAVFCLTQAVIRFFCPRWIVAVSQMLFFFLFGLSTFFFLLVVSDGVPRGYLLAGEAFGSILLLCLFATLRQKGIFRVLNSRIRHRKFRRVQRKRKRTAEMKKIPKNAENRAKTACFFGKKSV